MYEKLENHCYSLINIINLQFKSIVASNMMLFSIFLLPLIMMIGMGSLLPTSVLVAPVFSAIPMLIIGVVFSNLYFSLEKSTFKDNSKLSNVGRKTRIISMWIITFSFVTISQFINIILLIIFESNDVFFMDRFTFYSQTNYHALDIIWKDVQWGNFIYFVFMTQLISLATYTFTIQFFNDLRTFSIFLITYFFLVLIFGGVVSIMFLANQSFTGEENYIGTRDQYNVGGYVNLITDVSYDANGNIIDFKYENVFIPPSVNEDFSSAWQFSNFTQYLMFFLPNSFINQQFAGLFLTGANQSIDFYGWDQSNDLFLNIYAINQYDIQNHTNVASSYGIYQDIDGSWSVDNLNFAHTLRTDVSFWKWNGDYAWDLTTIASFVYLILLTYFGFEINKKYN